MGDSVAWEVNTREDSPFIKISNTNMKPDQLFMLHSFGKNVKRVFETALSTSK